VGIGWTHRDLNPHTHTHTHTHTHDCTMPMCHTGVLQDQKVMIFYLVILGCLFRVKSIHTHMFCVFRVKKMVFPSGQSGKDVWPASGLGNGISSTVVFFVYLLFLSRMIKFCVPKLFCLMCRISIIVSAELFRCGSRQ
jgi:hypothetical protein